METAAILVFAVLPCLVLAVLAVTALAFFREAFAPAAMANARPRGPQLPLLSGESLRRWASEWAQRIVARRVAKGRSGQDAVALAREIESEASKVLERSLPAVVVSPRARCSDCQGEPIRVTAPEALAIAEELRENLSPYERRRIYEQARKNLQLASAAETPAATAACPLVGESGRCSVFAVRPLRCRGRGCPQCDAPQDEDRAAQAVAAGPFAATLGQGLTEGFSQGLTAAGLDGRTYELNRAIVRALDEPNALVRWARGEEVFDAAPQAV